ncbi:hypothetical protein EIP86_000390 [Pleurotus ostreatoroseus]|nr:hypothetical protein EIP86_000390 [Pleurotus ostreatoroseus]
MATSNGDSAYEILVHNLTFSFAPNDPSVQSSLVDVSLQLPKGSRTILIGANGAGKSTLLQILAGKRLISKDGTVVKIKDKDVFRQYPAGITFLGTEWAMNPVVRGDIVVADFLNSVGGYRHKTRRDALLDILDVDLDWHMHAISDGERRRVQLVMGLMGEWDVLLLDEVTVDLDVLVRDDLLKFLKKDSEERGATILYATHIFDGLNEFPTHVAHMCLGSFVTLPTPWPSKELIAGGPNTQLYSIALQWLREDRAHRQELEKNGRKVRGARRDDTVPEDSETFYKNLFEKKLSLPLSLWSRILFSSHAKAQAAFPAIPHRPVIVQRTSNVFRYSGSGHGIAAGAVAGAVVASVVGLIVVVLLFLWYRRRARLRRASEEPEAKADAPARAEDVLNRPDPNREKQQTAPAAGTAVQGNASASRTTINLDPEAQNAAAAGASGSSGPSARPGVRASVQSNPFTDTHSIQSASTGTQSNVIPIALVPPGSIRSLNSAVPSTQATSGTGPARPVRTPDLDLNLDHANASNESVRTGNQYALSTRSGVTNARNSYMTTGSFASDFLNEAPVIVTPTTRSVKQVVGLVKAEVVRTPPGGNAPSVYSSEGSLTPRTASSAVRTPGRSPLAGASFGPSDALHNIAEDEDHQEVTTRSDPFGDEHSPYASKVDLAQSTITSATYGDSEENWDTQAPRRPESFMTQAGSIISAEFGTASRVHLGLDKLSPSQAMQASPRTLGVPSASDLPHTPVSAVLSTALNTPRSPYRMTSAKLVAPQTADDSPVRGALEQQQRRAFEELDARMSRSSVVSSTSTRADSILEGFPFVPPSPISDRPIRTPPRSPLAQQAFNNAHARGAGSPLATPAAPSMDAAAAQVAAKPTTETGTETPDSPLPPPPNRKQLGMSTASQSSTASNGLGQFPFQIDSGNGPVAADASGSPPSSFLGRQRASLDTLALTADLSSYPLGFDKAAMENYPGPPRRS